MSPARESLWHVVTFAVMALAEVARPLRFANAAFGAWDRYVRLGEGWPRQGVSAN